GPVADVQTAGALYQYTASEAFAGGRYTFLWRSGSGPNEQLLARTMDTAGSVSPVVTVASPGTSTGSAQVVPGPTNRLLMVWTAGGNVNGRFADASPNFLSPPFPIMGGMESSAAYSTTTGKWFVVSGGSNLYGALVDASGNVSVPELLATGTPASG